MARPTERNRRRSSGGAARGASSGAPAVEPSSPRAIELLAATLVFARLLTPPEGSALGQTLWITQCWFGVALLAVWLRLRDGARPRAFDRFDAGVFLLTLGHLVSGTRLLVLHDGDRRFALNMIWEWAALATSYTLLRLVLDDAGRRAAWQRGMVALAIAFSGLGVWQHYISHPAEVRRYDALRRELDEWTTLKPKSNDEATERERRLRELRAELTRQQIPLEDPARRQFEDRLRGSSEPIGLFALANTLAGWIAVWGIVLAGALVAARRDRRLKRPVGLALIAFCLILTKSRTAWVGTASGLAIWAALAWTSRRRADQSARDPARRRGRFLATLAGGALLVAALIGVAAWSGGLDREVIAQAPRSLKFRLQYWHGALAVLSERWLWGTGPGNFRPHYLKHKLPEASEEIADPHNLFLDVWASGGLIALLGLGALGVAVVTSRRAGEAPVDVTEAAPAGPTASRCAHGAATAFLAWIVVIASFGGGRDELLRMAAVAAGTALAWRILGNWPTSSRVTTASMVALLVHLLGAGGIEMPAVTQCLLLLLVFLVPHGDESKPQDETPALSSTPGGKTSRVAAAGTSLMWSALAGGTALVAFIACLLTATRPVLIAETAVAAGDAEAARGLFGVAERHYAEAATADPFSPAPFERLTELFFERWRHRTGDEARRDFEKAVDAGQAVLELDPHDPNGYRRLGELWAARFARTRAVDDAREAVRWFDEAAARYPNQSRLRAARAEALAGAGRAEDAATEAAEALRLDAINRREGHADKILPEETTARLKSLERATLP